MAKHLVVREAFGGHVPSETITEESLVDEITSGPNAGFVTAIEVETTQPHPTNTRENNP